jgi:hypothetical protein
MQRQPRTGPKGAGRVASVTRWRNRVVWQQMARERFVALRTDQRELAPCEPRDGCTPRRTIGEPESQRSFRRSKRWTGRNEPPRWPGTPARPGACSWTLHPLRRMATVPSGSAVARWHPRERGVPGPPGNGDAGWETGNQTSWACVVEIHHRVRGGVNRQGREKRRRRPEAGVEARDEARSERNGVIRGERTTPGSGSPGLGAPKGRRTPREDASVQDTAVARHVITGMSRGRGGDPRG